MVATFSDFDSSVPLFSYLKPCKPAPGIADNLRFTDPFDRRPPDSRRQRVLSLLLGTAQIAAVALGLWASASSPPVTVDSELIPTQPQETLWNALGSDELAQVITTAKQEQTEAALAAAEQERLQAQQLRLDAEAKAQNLTAQAANQARQTTVEAMRRADAIALDASYMGAEQVIYAEAGSEISLKFDARIQCKEGSFGEIAVASPVDSRVVPREVRNLAICYPSPETKAGQPVGEAGAWGVAFFKLDNTKPE